MSLSDKSNQFRRDVDRGLAWFTILSAHLFKVHGESTEVTVDLSIHSMVPDFQMQFGACSMLHEVHGLFHMEELLGSHLTRVYRSREPPLHVVYPAQRSMGVFLLCVRQMGCSVWYSIVSQEEWCASFTRSTVVVVRSVSVGE